MSPVVWKDYHSWRWWIRWFVPYPVLIRLSRKQIGRHHVWYQSADIQPETNPRGDRTEPAKGERNR